MGDILAIDYHSVIPFYETLDYAPEWACLTEPGTLAFAREHAVKAVALAPAGTKPGLFLEYDEFRSFHNCADCQKKFATAGELLAWHASALTALLGGPHGVSPAAPIYAWNDMFDPYHNARDGYYRVDGTIEGSWKGLAAGVQIFNWHPVDGNDPNYRDLTASLKFFAGLEARSPVAHRQIIAGYYDSKEGGGEPGYERAKHEFSKAAGIAGVVGMMYTTWGSNYDELENYARGSKEGWTAYKAARPPKP